MSKPTKRSERLRVDKQGLFKLVGYVPHPGQQLVHDSLARFRVLGCGARWGKTVAAAMECVAALLQPADKARGWIVAPSRDLVDRIFERVFAVFREHFPGRILDEDARAQRLIVKNLGGGTTELRGKSAENAVSLLGEALDFLIVDEAAALPASTWEQCLSARLIDRRGWALLVSTPNGANWFFLLFRRGQHSRDADFASWCSPSWDNPHVDRATIDEERKRLPADVWNEQYAAKFLGVPDNSCDLCGRPDPDVPGSYVYLGEGDPAQCVECQGIVDADNHTVIKLWPNGVARSKIIVLGPESDEPPPPDPVPELPPEPAPEAPPEPVLVMFDAAPGLDDLDE